MEGSFRLQRRRGAALRATCGLLDVVMRLQATTVVSTGRDYVTVVAPAAIVYPTAANAGVRKIAPASTAVGWVSDEIEQWIADRIRERDHDGLSGSSASV